jgi:hypothetical protein|eukprot:COSAG01_NODE_2436_length_7700_cov_2.891199_1_plen_84_part_00
MVGAVGAVKLGAVDPNGWDVQALMVALSYALIAAVALVGTVMLLHGLFALMGRRGSLDRTVIRDDAHLTQTLRRASQAATKHK